MKRMLSILLAVMMVLTTVSCAFTSFAEEESPAEETGVQIYDSFEFGRWPQTYIQSQTLLDAFENIEVTMTSYGFTSGRLSLNEVGDVYTGLTNFSYGDFNYGGQRYRKVVMKSRRATVTTGTSFSYSGTFYFRWDPIEWYVTAVDSETVTAVSHRVLDGQPYSYGFTDVSYEESFLRGWMNNFFYANAFSSNEKLRLLLTERYGCADYVYLPGRTEVVSEDGVFMNSMLANGYAEGYSVLMNGNINVPFKNTTCAWNIIADDGSTATTFLGSGRPTSFNRNYVRGIKPVITVSKDVLTIGSDSADAYTTAKHTHLFSKPVRADYAKVQERNCTGPALYRYTCVYCKQIGGEATFGDTSEKNYHYPYKHPSEESYAGKQSTYVEKYYYTCEKCGEVIKKYNNGAAGETFTQMIPHEHAMQLTSTTAPTCTTEGKKVYKCYFGCGSSRTEVIPKLEHKKVKIVNDLAFALPPTETEPALYYYTCLYCSKVLNRTDDGSEGEMFEYDPNHAHEPGVVDSTPATCKSAQCDTVQCIYCGADRHKEYVGQRIDHHYKIIAITYPTCTSGGVESGFCEYCGEQGYVDTPKLGHDLTIVSKRVISKATCEHGTIYAYKCSRCNAYTVESGYEDVSTKLEHKPSAVESEAAVYIPGDGTHLTTYFYTCSRCGQVIEDETQTFQAGELDHEHTYQEISRTEPTCTGYGSITYRCTECTSTVTEAIQPLGHLHSSIVAEYEAGCTTHAYTTYHCNRCGKDVDDIRYGTALGHDFSVREKIADADCTHDTKYQLYCSRCGARGGTDVDYMSRLGHVPTVYSRTEPTCTNYGITKYLCDRCYSYWTETYGEPTGIHHYELAETEEPTCTHKGIRYYACVDCYDTYEEEFGEIQPHDLHLRGTSGGSCTTSMKLNYSCSNCSYQETKISPPLGHDLRVITDLNPTCTRNGLIERECQRYGCHYIESETIPATGHDFEQTDVQQPTCSALGMITKTCKTCGEKVYEYFGELKEHQYKLAEQVAPGCLRDGAKIYMCTVCSARKDEILPAVGHDFLLSEITEPTCQQPGKEIYTCAGCGEVREKVISDKVGHDYQLVSQTEPTCVSKGAYTYACIFCGATMSEEIPALGHDFSDHSTVVLETATCYHGNIYYGKCAKCGLLSKAYPYEDENSVLAHQGTKVISKETLRSPQTETQDATYYYTCSQCGLILKENVPGFENEYFIDESQHVHHYELVQTITPTCQNVGMKVYRCEGCGGGFRVIFAQTTQHKEGTVLEHTDATCTSPSLTRYLCEYCGEEITVSDEPALGHDYSEFSDVIYTSATCTENARYYSKCSRCAQVNMSADDVIEAPGSALTHQGEERITQRALRTPAQCDTYATYYYTCARCDAVLRDEYFSDTSIELKEHDYQLDTQQSTASCTSSGIMVYKCRNCDATYTDTLEEPIGHRYVYERDEMKTAATCKDDETYCKVYVCENCGEEYTDFSEVFTRQNTADPSLHVISEMSEQTQPTCTECGERSGTCEVCGKEVSKEIAPLGHDYSDKVCNVYTIVSAANCGKNAVYNYTCARCGDVSKDKTFELEDTALEHNFTKREISEQALRTRQTATQGATYYFTCVNCGEIDTRANHYFTDITYKPILKNLIKYGEEFEFGSWPQTLVKDNSLIAQLEKLDATAVSFGYRYTSTLGLFYNTVDMTYADVYYGGDRYRKVTIGSYRPYTVSVSPLYMESYQSTNGYEQGGEYWFKWEPITWQVLSVNGVKAELISKKIIDARYFTEDYMNASSTSWKESAVRAWLNDSFYQNAFSELEQEYILEETNTNYYHFLSQTNKDKVYLLSLDDLLNRSLAVQRRAVCTDYTLAQGIWSSYEARASWLTRTQEYDRNNVIIADEYGNIDPFFSTTQLGGIRAAVSLSMTKGYKNADLNADGYIDIADLSTVLSCLGQGVEEPIEAFDLNDNAMIDTQDISIILLDENYGNIG